MAGLPIEREPGLNEAQTMHRKESVFILATLGPVMPMFAGDLARDPLCTMSAMQVRAAIHALRKSGWSIEGTPRTGFTFRPDRAQRALVSAAFDDWFLNDAGG